MEIEKSDVQSSPADATQQVQETQMQYAIISRDGMLEKNNFSNDVLPLREISRFYNIAKFLLESINEKEKMKKAEILLDSQKKIVFYPIGEEKMAMIFASATAKEEEVERFAQNISK